ncbi:hypothetical protein ACFVW9_21120 [Streptomyces sp. NPDC058217]|uniref:hypothetical protein n=1 Tax=Streptomyces sp. NPDC058217 TaxID=3346384 RepID=UPI0036E210C9
MFTSGDGRLVVRCFSQDGNEFADYDLSVLTMATGLRDALTAAFVKRTAPGAGLTSLHSTEKNYWSLVQFDRYLRTLPWPPREVSHLTPEHIDGFYETRKHLATAVRGEISDLKQLLIRTEGISSTMAGRLAAPLPPKPSTEPKESYSRTEFKRIADAARGDLRTAAQRIRANRDLLQRFRQGEIEIGNDRLLAERLELLDWVNRFGDVPRKRRESGRDSGKDVPLRWISGHGHGSAPEVISWLHLTAPELAAGAILLGVLTGENPDVIFKTPAAHHRADGYTGRTGTTIVDLVKPRRGTRAYMNLALSDVPDWISIPDEPEEMTTRDELHTPFGLYMLLHELTACSRALAGGDLLLVGYCASGGREQGRGLRPVNRTSGLIGDRASAWGLRKDELDEDGKSVPLTLTLSLLRLTYIELHQKPVAHTEKTAATQYLLRNRGNVTEYRKVVAAALTEEAAKARARGSVAVMSADDVEWARTNPEAVAADHGVEPLILKKMIAGELDTVMTSCTDNKNGPHAPAGTPCPASFMLCLDCECARALPRHLPIQVLVHDQLSERREQMDVLQWVQRFAGPLARLTDLLAEADEAAVTDARRDATDTDRALVERFLNRELDLR